MKPKFPFPEVSLKLLEHALEQLHADPEPPDVFELPWETLEFIGAPLAVPMPYSVRVQDGDPHLHAPFTSIWDAFTVESLTGVPGEFMIPYPYGISVNEDGPSALYVREIAAGPIKGMDVPGGAGLTYQDLSDPDVLQEVAFSPERQLTVDDIPLSATSAEKERYVIDYEPDTFQLRLDDEEIDTYSRQEMIVAGAGISDVQEFVSTGSNHGRVPHRIYDTRWSFMSNSTANKEEVIDGVRYIVAIGDFEAPYPEGMWVPYFRTTGPGNSVALGHVQVLYSESTSDLESENGNGYYSYFEPKIPFNFGFGIRFGAWYFTLPGQWRLTERLQTLYTPRVQLFSEGEATQEVRYKLGGIANVSRRVKLEMLFDSGGGWTHIPARGRANDSEGFSAASGGVTQSDFDTLPSFLAEKITLSGERPEGITPLLTYLDDYIRIYTRSPRVPAFYGELSEEQQTTISRVNPYIFVDEETGDKLLNPFCDLDEEGQWGGIVIPSKEYAVGAFVSLDIESNQHTYHVAAYRQGSDYRVAVALDRVHVTDTWSIFDFFPQNVADDNGVTLLSYSDGTIIQRPEGETVWPLAGRMNLLPNYDFMHRDFPFRYSCRVGPFRVRARAVADKVGVSFGAGAAECPVTLYLESFLPQLESARDPDA